MSATMIETTYTIEDWKEEPHHQVEGELKMTHAIVKKSYAGVLFGTGVADLLMVYRDDGTVHYTGMERIVGQIGEKAGSFVLKDEGIFEGCQATGKGTVLVGTGTGDLARIAGGTSYALGEGRTCPLRFVLKSL